MKKQHFIYNNNNNNNNLTIHFKFGWFFVIIDIMDSSIKKKSFC